MSHWNYRLVCTIDTMGNEVFGIEEVYYDDDNHPTMCTDDMSIGGYDSVEDALEAYTMMYEAFNAPVLKYPEDFYESDDEA